MPPIEQRKYRNEFIASIEAMERMRNDARFGNSFAPQRGGNGLRMETPQDSRK
jgi:hypothetical protein